MASHPALQEEHSVWPEASVPFGVVLLVASTDLNRAVELLAETKRSRSERNADRDWQRQTVSKIRKWVIYALVALIGSFIVFGIYESVFRGR
jgi:hypothetical protein